MSISDQLRAVVDRAALEELLRRHGISKAAVIRGMAVTPGEFLADALKPDDSLAFKPDDSLAFKPDDSLAFKPDDSLSGHTNGAGDVDATAVMAAAAILRADDIVKDLRTLQSRVSGEDRAKLEKGLNYLETELGKMFAAVKSGLGQRNSKAPSAGRDRRAVHIHLHLEA